MPKNNFYPLLIESRMNFRFISDIVNVFRQKIIPIDFIDRHALESECDYRRVLSIAETILQCVDSEHGDRVEAGATTIRSAKYLCSIPPCAGPDQAVRESYFDTPGNHDNTGGIVRIVDQTLSKMLPDSRFGIWNDWFGFCSRSGRRSLCRKMFIFISRLFRPQHSQDDQANRQHAPNTNYQV